MKISELEFDECDEVIALWDRCGLTRPWNDPKADINLALKTSTSTIYVGKHEGNIVSSIMVGCDGHRGWVYYLAVAPDLQEAGLGREMMDVAEKFVQEQGAVKLQLMVRTDNDRATGFYRSLGYAKEETSVFGKRFDGKSWSVVSD